MQSSSKSHYASARLIFRHKASSCSSSSLCVLTVPIQLHHVLPHCLIPQLIKLNSCDVSHHCPLVPPHPPALVQGKTLSLSLSLSLSLPTHYLLMLYSCLPTHCILMTYSSTSTSAHQTQLGMDLMTCSSGTNAHHCSHAVFMLTYSLPTHSVHQQWTS